MKKYRIDLEIIDELFFEFEIISEGKNGHECIVSGNTKKEVAKKIAMGLVPFIEDNLEEV